MKTLEKKITIFRNHYNGDPLHVTVAQALERIRSGRSRTAIEGLRAENDSERRDAIKKALPAVIWAGELNGRKVEHGVKSKTGLIILDFDKCGPEKKEEIKQSKYIFAAWISPSGNGVKALVKIADGRHEDFFKTLLERFKMDPQGREFNKLCAESYDPDLYLNEDSEVWDLLPAVNAADGKSPFQKLQQWLNDKGDAFVSGSRNAFIYKLAAACCRVGIDQYDCISEVSREYLGRDSDFTQKEALQTVKSAYRTNLFGSAEFRDNDLYERGKDVKIDMAVYDRSAPVKDVVFGSDVKDKAFDIYNRGYEQCETWGIPEIDKHWKLKRGEVTCLTGIGNYGKSSFLRFLMLCKSLKDGSKWAIFGPEDFPAEEFYFDLVENVAGMRLDAKATNERVNSTRFSQLYDFVSEHFFYVYPEVFDPTPDYVKERFLEMIVKKKVDGCVIDPFNQLANDYSKARGRDDKYLETFLSDIGKFARENHIWQIIIAHPTKLSKNSDGEYDCPDVFDLAGGAMWNNKCDNIVVYHRPGHQTNPNDPSCEFHSKKIRRQKVVGQKGMALFEFHRQSRRFMFQGRTYIDQLMPASIAAPTMQPNNEFIRKPYADDDSDDMPF
jgi:hypothetical protein